MEFALEVGLTEVVIEGNLNIVYKDLSNANSSLSLHGYLIQDVKTLIPYIFLASVLVMYVSKEIELLMHYQEEQLDRPI